LLVSEAQGACPTEVVDSEEEVHGIKGSCGEGLARAAGFLALFGVVALDHPSPPAVGLGIGYGSREHRPARSDGTEILRTGYERETGR